MSKIDSTNMNESGSPMTILLVKRICLLINLSWEMWWWNIFFIKSANQCVDVLAILIALWMKILSTFNFVWYKLVIWCQWCYRDCDPLFDFDIVFYFWASILIVIKRIYMRSWSIDIILSNLIHNTFDNSLPQIYII
jgi:hypothetical protein